MGRLIQNGVQSQNQPYHVFLMQNALLFILIDYHHDILQLSLTLEKKS